jgi:Ca2+-binding RTX toxin-like protein
MPTVTDSVELRSAIQSATSSTVISLDGLSVFAVTTLAKEICVFPSPFPASGYTIEGNGQVIQDTRIYQENIDGPYSPGKVLGGSDPNNPLSLTLQYNTNGATDGTALLRSTSGDYILDNLYLTGNHRGWDGNSNLYISIATSIAASPVNVDLTLSNSTIDITGQGGFDPAVTAGGGSAFLHSFNNTGNVSLEANTFDESGFLSSFNFFNQTDNTVGNYAITNCLFTRVTNTSVVRRRGNRLTNVTATLTNNTFENGSFLDVFGNVGGITFDGPNNVFDTIADGFGIRGTSDPILGPLTNTITLTSAAVLTFSGAGMPLKYVSSTPGDLTIDSLGLGGSVVIDGRYFLKASAGGQAGDLLDAATTGMPTTKYWAYGDQGNDTLRGGTEEDYLDGAEGDDLISANSGNDTLLGGLGNDSIFGDAGADFLDAGENNDSLLGGSGNDTILAGEGNDNCFGGADDDSIVGGNGNDTLAGENGNDFLDGGDGTDTLTGGAGNDRIFGGALNDVLAGDAGNDTLIGESGFDSLIGGVGADSLTGGPDTMNRFNQSVNDSFAATGRSNAGPFAAGQTFTYGNKLDIITDFKPGSGSSADRLDIQGAGVLPGSAIGRSQGSGGLVNGINYYLSGTFNDVTNVFTVASNGATGSSTLILQGTGGTFLTNVSAILLSGVNSTLLVATNFI